MSEGFEDILQEMDRQVEAISVTTILDIIQKRKTNLINSANKYRKDTNANRDLTSRIDELYLIQKIISEIFAKSQKKRQAVEESPAK